MFSAKYELSFLVYLTILFWIQYLSTYLFKVHFIGTDAQAILGKGHVQLPGHFKSAGYKPPYSYKNGIAS